MTEQKKYLDLREGAPEGGYPQHLWWDEDDPSRIHLTISDPRFTDANGEKQGLHFILHASPESGVYAPADFNRAARVLREAGRPAPEHDVPVYSRRLDQRAWAIAKVNGKITDGLVLSGQVSPEGEEI